jgi:protein O-GlcNAcase/histone acetyltransferase
MAARARTNLLTGVIEGFYGKPWSALERLQLLAWMADWALDTYVYAPKDDLHHRTLWREPYPAADAADLGALIRACGASGIRFVFALGPGLDLRYSDPADLTRLEARFDQMHAIGCRDFALLFDDIPDRLAPPDAARFASFAAAHSHVANALFHWARARSLRGRFFVCPTPYCGRMAAREVGGRDYLATLGRELAPEIDVFWTGPEIVSAAIPVDHVREIQALLRRQPVIWDNLQANDYDGRRFYCGPYAGRPPELRDEVRGLLVNPNCEFPLNYVPLRTLAEFARGASTWDARAAYLAAMREWLPAFASAGQPIEYEDLVLLGDCFYLPHQDGDEAEALCQSAGRLLVGEPSAPRELAGFRHTARRLQATCTRLAELRDRPLFHALSRRTWDLREELDLLLRGLDALAKGTTMPRSFASDFHLPGTYRGGMIARLQRMLDPLPDGSFVPAQLSARSPAHQSRE